MSRRFKKLLSILMAGIMPLSLAACGADVSGTDSSKTNSNGGWLAVYPALYEANMGVNLRSSRLKSIQTHTARAFCTMRFLRTALTSSL